MVVAVIEIVIVPEVAVARYVPKSDALSAAAVIVPPTTVTAVNPVGATLELLTAEITVPTVVSARQYSVPIERPEKETTLVPAALSA